MEKSYLVVSLVQSGCEFVITVHPYLVNTGDLEAAKTGSLSESHWVNKVVEGEEGRTLLLTAVEQKLDHYVEVLLRAGAMPDLFSQELGLAPLHAAVNAGDLSITRNLLLAGARVNQTNR